MAVANDHCVNAMRLHERPFHAAYINEKIPCPLPQCRRDFRNDFFEVNRLVQHFRAKHSGVTFTDKHVDEAKCVLKSLHGEETKSHLEKLSAARRNLVSTVFADIYANFFLQGRVIIHVDSKLL